MILDIGVARVFYDGLLIEPMLDHPEELTFDADGNLYVACYEPS